MHEPIETDTQSRALVTDLAVCLLGPGFFHCAVYVGHFPHMQSILREAGLTP